MSNDPLADLKKALTPIERLRQTLAMADAGYHVTIELDDAEELLAAYDDLVAKAKEQEEFDWAVLARLRKISP